MEFKLDEEGSGNIRVLREQQDGFLTACIYTGLKNCCESGVEAVGKKDRRWWLQTVILGIAIMKAVLVIPVKGMDCWRELEDEIIGRE